MNVLCCPGFRQQSRAGRAYFKVVQYTSGHGKVYQQNILREYPLVTAARPVARREAVTVNSNRYNETDGVNSLVHQLAFVIDIYFRTLITDRLGSELHWRVGPGDHIPGLPGTMADQAGRAGPRPVSKKPCSGCPSAAPAMTGTRAQGNPSKQVLIVWEKLNCLLSNFCWFWFFFL